MEALVPLALRTTLLTLKVILFDLDGTLEDTMEAIYKTIENLRAIFGYDTSPRDTVLPIVCEMTPSQAVDFYVPRQVKCRLDAISPKFIFRYVGWLHQYCRDRLARALPDITDSLKELKGMGIRLALVTSNSENAVLGFLDKYDLHDVFEEHTSAELGLRKAEAIKLVLTKLGFRPEDCIFVGDTAKDIRESREAGVLAVGVLSGAHDLKRLQAEKPFAILKSVSELPLLVETAKAQILSEA